MSTDKKRFYLPSIGLRNLKTAISATLCVLLFGLIDRNPTFACIGAVFGMDSSVASSVKTGGNRLIGTILGGFLGMLFFWISHQLNSDIAYIVLLFVGIIVLIYLSQVLHFAGAIQAGAVVFYIVMINTTENQYISYALNRMLDTGIGVLMSLAINYLTMQKPKQQVKE